MAHIVDGNTYHLSLTLQAERDPYSDISYIKGLYFTKKPSGEKDILS